MTALFKSLLQKKRAFQNLAMLTSSADAVRFTWARLRGHREVTLRLKNPSCDITLRPRNSDFDVLLQTFVSGGCDVRELVKGPRRIVDGGANIGLTAIQFASHYPEAEIIAVEPEPANYELLVRNTAGFAKVRPVQAAIWPKAARVSLQHAHDDPRSWSFQTREAAETDGGSAPACQALPIGELLCASALRTSSNLTLTGLNGRCWSRLTWGGLTTRDCSSWSFMGKTETRGCRRPWLASRLRCGSSMRR